jgi:hypothetical protein
VTEAVATGATFTVVAAVADVGTFVAGVVVAVVDGKATSAFPDKSIVAGVVVAVVDGKATSEFPDKSIQQRLGSVRTAKRAGPSTLARYTSGRVFWMARTRDQCRFVAR